MALFDEELVSASVSKEAQLHQDILSILIDGLSKGSNQPVSIIKVELDLVILFVPLKVAPIVVLLVEAVQEAKSSHVGTITPNDGFSNVGIVGDIECSAVLV